MSKSPFNLDGMSTDINLNRLGNFSLTPQTRKMKQVELAVQAINAKKNLGKTSQNSFADMQGMLFDAMGPGSVQDSNSQLAPGLSNIPSINSSINNVSNQVADQVLGSMPNASSSLVNPFGLQAQGAIGGTFGSLFDRQNSMGSALAKRACKYKNKK
jgi:hypothetical protein